MHSTVINYDHKIFLDIDLLPDQIIEDHAMATYRKAIDSANFTCKRLRLESSDSNQHAYDHLFPQHIEERFLPMTAIKKHEVGEEDDHSLIFDKNKFESSAPAAMEAVATEPSAEKDKETHALALTQVEGKLAMEVEVVQSPASQCDWCPCSICNLDVTWPYIMHSDASRAMTKHRCALCQRVVCVVCAPAGDQISGDGLSQKHHLSDYSIPLPHLGLFTPQRVCIHCYYDSSYPGIYA